MDFHSMSFLRSKSRLLKSTEGEISFGVQGSGCIGSVAQQQH